VVSADVGGDPAQPGGEAELPTEAVDRLQRPLEHLLDDVFGFAPTSEAPFRLGQEHRVVQPHDLGEGLRIAAAMSFDERLVAPLTGPTSWSAIVRCQFHRPTPLT
jgi:hypothetical protein